MRVATAGSTNAESPRRRCPPGSPSWSPRARTTANAVPDTTPSWPIRETVEASRQLETATPIPPWITRGGAPAWVIARRRSSPSEDGRLGVVAEHLLQRLHDLTLGGQRP